VSASSVVAAGLLLAAASVAVTVAALAGANRTVIVLELPAPGWTGAGVASGGERSRAGQRDLAPLLSIPGMPRLDGDMSFLR
jgi:hypothetical protein